MPEQPKSRLTNLSIATARFALSAWVGAAVLFVIVGIKEVRAPAFDSSVRDQLVAIRFPAYYAFGFALVGVAWFALGLATFLDPRNRRRWGLSLVMISLVVAGMMIDYYGVYLPLLEMITPPGQSRPAEFVSYHETSKWLNFFAVSIAAIIAIFLCSTMRTSGEN